MRSILNTRVTPLSFRAARVWFYRLMAVAPPTGLGWLLAALLAAGVMLGRGEW